MTKSLEHTALGVPVPLSQSETTEWVNLVIIMLWMRFSFIIPLTKVTAKDALDILSETRTWDDFPLWARDIGERTDQSFLSACQIQYIEDLNDRIDWR